MQMRTRRLHSSIPPEMSRMNAEVTQEPNQPPTPHLHIGVDICLLISTISTLPPSLPPSLIKQHPKDILQRISKRILGSIPQRILPKRIPIPAKLQQQPGQQQRATTTININQQQSTTICKLPANQTATLRRCHSSRASTHPIPIINNNNNINNTRCPSPFPSSHSLSPSSITNSILIPTRSNPIKVGGGRWGVGWGPSPLEPPKMIHCSKTPSNR